MRSAPEWYGSPVLEVMLLDHDEPTNYEEAMMSPDSAKWLEAMKSEMRSMYENKVWTLVDLPDVRQVIEIKWIPTQISWLQAILRNLGSPSLLHSS